MSDTLLQSIPQMSDAEQAEWDAMMVEMHRLNEIMRQDQIKIDHIKAETEAIKQAAAHYKAEAKKFKAEHDQWYQETVAQGQDNRAVLERMKALVAQW